MTTTLQTAVSLLKQAENYYATSEEKDGNAYWRGRSEQSYQAAAIYAAVATAEALERIATALELIHLGGEMNTPTITESKVLARKAERYLRTYGLTEAEVVESMMEQEFEDGTCEALDGCIVEADGVCEHGYPSWLRYLGLI